MVPLISVVDDDISVRKSLDRLIRAVHLEVRTFASAEAFLNSFDPRKPDCLILDVSLPGMNGIELYRHLLGQKSTIPVIFITAHATADLESLKAASGREVAYFTKPFSADELIDAVNVALKTDAGG